MAYVFLTIWATIRISLKSLVVVFSTYVFVDLYHKAGDHKADKNPRRYRVALNFVNLKF